MDASSSSSLTVSPSLLTLCWTHVYAATPQGTTLCETVEEMRVYRDLLHLFHACINVYNEPSMEDKTSFIKHEYLVLLGYDALQKRIKQVRTRLIAFLMPTTLIQSIYARVDCSRMRIQSNPIKVAVDVLDMLEAPPLLNLILQAQENKAIALLKCGADTRVRFFSGMTALEMAIKKGLVETIEALVSHNEKLLDMRDAQDRTPLHLAAQQTSSAVLETLLKKLWQYRDLKICLRAVDQWGLTPLTEAIQMGHVRHVRLLLKAGSDANHVPMIGNTPSWPPIAHAVTHTAPNQPSESLTLLIAHRADVNLSIGPSATALTMACHVGNLDLVQQLVKAGARLHLEECEEKQQPIARARRQGHMHVVTWLEQLPSEQPNKKQKRQSSLSRRVVRLCG